MSDAIVLDVAEQPTIALDAGTADPVARDEIAELQAEVATIRTEYLAKSEVDFMSTADVLALYE
jgi:hypothetical protein